MSIVPASRLSASDMARLGNNVGSRAVRSAYSRRDRDLVAAVNRSLAIVGEKVSRLHRPSVTSARSIAAASVA